MTKPTCDCYSKIGRDGYKVSYIHYEEKVIKSGFLRSVAVTPIKWNNSDTECPYCGAKAKDSETGEVV